jgi:TRAP transporter 4TM/12TM fusion protein
MNEKSELQKASRYRSLTGIPKAVTIVLPAAAIGIGIYYIFMLSIGGLVLYSYAYFFLLIMLLLPLTFLLVPATQKASRDKVAFYDIILATLTFGISAYFFLNSYKIMALSWSALPPVHVYPMCLLLLLSILEGVRRVAGIFFAGTCLFFLLFPLFAGVLPGLLAGVTFSFSNTLAMHAFGGDGILGIPMRVVGTIILGYLIFAAALNAAGGGRFFMNIATGLLGHVRGGPAKIAILASAIFGSISGSAPANVVSTGSFTIPVMKEVGYPPEYAGAVEACASTGGVLMPPVMGATAFVMAEFLGMSYVNVALAAFIPSILYYFCIFVQVDARAAKLNLIGLPKESLPSVSQTFKEGWFFIAALMVLIYYLLVEREAARAPFFAIPLILGLPMINKKTRLHPRAFISFLEGTGRILSEIMPSLLGMGLIINSLLITGLAGAISDIIIAVAGDNLIFLLLLGACACFILGMGVSITVCYIVLALLVAPSLIKTGLNPLAVHLFMMYWGMVSYITPPVCVSCFAAAPIAGTSPIKIGFNAMRLGVGMYILPFIFVLQPALILHGSLVETLRIFFVTALGLYLIGGGASEGHIFKLGRVGAGTRIFLFTSGILFCIPGWEKDIMGLGLLILIVAACLLKRKRELRKEDLGLPAANYVHSFTKER